MNKIQQYEVTGNFGAMTLLLEEYNGKYKSNPLMISIQEDPMVAQVAYGMDRILARLGLPADGMIMHLGFDDNMKEFASTSTMYDRLGNQVQIVILSAKNFIRLYDFVTNIYEEIKHEGAHAVQRHWMQKNYETVPKWWREGSALYAAWPQGDVRVLSHYGLKAINIKQLVTNLNPRRFGMVNYPESYLAVVCIAEEYGVPTIHNINRRLDIEPFVEVLETELRMPYNRFRVEAGNFALLRMQEHQFIRDISRLTKKMKGLKLW